jgi:ATP synthase protein I
MTDDKDIDPRLEKIKSDLATLMAHEKQIETKQKEKDTQTESLSVGLRAGAELVTSIAAGGLIGYWLDSFFETKPLFLIAMLVLGVITGFVNVWRTTQNIGYEIGLKDVKIRDKK